MKRGMKEEMKKVGKGKRKGSEKVEMENDNE